MGFEPEHLEHMLEEEEGPRVMTGPVFCDQCGYQLRMLPPVGRCPECGNSYRARGLKREGIFVPGSAEFPASDLAAGLVSAALVVWLVGGLFRRFDLWSLLFAALFGYMGYVFLDKALRRLRRFIRSERIASQANDDV